MSEEKWLPVRAYEDLYAVSNFGNVSRIKKYRNSKPLLKHVLASGYPRVGLCANGKAKRFLVHRLVAEAFLGIPEGMVVNHLNGIPTDCRLENLEICSMAHNEWHKRHVLKKNSRPSFTKLTPEKAAMIRAELSAGASGVSLSKKYGVCKSNISQIKNGTTWKHPY